MRWHIRALRHEAHVAERAGIDHPLEIAAGDAVDFTGWRGVDKIEETRKAVAEIEAPAAAMADVEHAPQFGVDPLGIVKCFVAPGDRVTGRSLEAAFTHRPPSLSGGARVSGEARQADDETTRDHQTWRLARSTARGQVSPTSRGPFGSAQRATFRPSPMSRTSRPPPRNPLPALSSPCRDTCRCTRAFRPRSPP